MTTSLPLPLAGRTVAVTGASKGIGLGIVELLTAQGASVIAGARKVDGLSLDEVIFLPLDVTNEDSVAEFARACISAGVDSLVNNAGVGSFMPVQQITVDEYRRVMDTNVLGTILMMKALVPHFQYRYAAGMRSQVVNITSDVSARTFGNGALYTASKYAQRAVTHALAHEGHAYGLRVTEVRPGMVDTYFNDSQPGDPEKIAWLKPTDIANAVSYALSAPEHVRIDEILLHPVVQDVAY